MKVLVYKDAKKPLQKNEEIYYHNLEFFIEQVYKDVLVSDIEGNFDIAHFIGLSSKEKIIKLKKEKNVPIVVTYIRKRSRQKEDDPTDLTIPNEEIKVLNMVDKIIVFTQNEYAILKNNEVETPIEVVGPGVREARFSSMNDLEVEAFIQYAGINKKDKIAVSMLDPRFSQDIINLYRIANEFKEMKFFVFVVKEDKIRVPWKNKRMIKKYPKNIKFMSEIDEDLYKSSLLRADYLITPSNPTNAEVLIYDAMITKTPIFAFYSSLFDTILYDKENAYICDDVEGAIKLIKDMYEHKIPLLVEEAYEFVNEESFEFIAPKINAIYRELLDKNKEI